MVIPDSVLDELEKVSEMEKSMKFLQARQGQVEMSLSVLRETITDQSNLVSEGDEAPKENKDLVETETLKPILNTIEKKRYENIGVEFAKGASKVFDELKKAEELKKKMSSKQVSMVKDKVEKTEKDNKKKKSGLGSLFLKLGLAIGAVVLVLEVFKNKIDEIIPGFSYNYDNFKSSIASVGHKITDAITDFLQNTIGKHIKNTFEGDDGVKGILRTFMTFSLPNIILAAGLELVKAFGGRVTNESQVIDSRLTSATATALADGSKREEQPTNDNGQARDNFSVLSDPFSTGRQIREATQQMGIDSLNVIGGSLVENLGKLISQNGTLSDSQASSFMSTLVQHGILNDDQITDDELKIIHERLGITENFDVWKQNQEVKAMFSGEGITTLKRATDEFNRRLSVLNNRGNIEELNRQLKSTAQRNIYNFDGSSTVKLKITPAQIGAEIGQDAFASELQQIFILLKGAFQGDASLGKKIMDEATGVVKYVYETFLLPIFDIIKTAFPDINIPRPNTEEQERRPAFTTRASSVPNSGSTINVTSSGNNPVVVVDLSLDPTTVGAALDIAKVAEELVKTVKKSNDKLKQLKNIQVNVSQLQSGNENSLQDDYNRKISVQAARIDSVANRVDNIEEYLEKNDRDSEEKADDDFRVLQSQ